MALIETKDLWKTYVMGSEEIHALRGVSINIEKGEYVAIMGPSGSGKSTLMNLIGCLDTPTKGSYLLNGKDVSKLARSTYDSLSMRQAPDKRRRATASRRRARKAA